MGSDIVQWINRVLVTLDYVLLYTYQVSASFSWAGNAHGASDEKLKIHKGKEYCYESINAFIYVLRRHKCWMCCYTSDVMAVLCHQNQQSSEKCCIAEFDKK